jgi:hypothetical protein
VRRAEIEAAVKSMSLADVRDALEQAGRTIPSGGASQRLALTAYRLSQLEEGASHGYG